MQQVSRMFPQKNGLQSLARTLCVVIFQLLLTHFCQGQPRLIGPPQPIIANIGGDIILPCHLEPGQDLVAMTLEWKRSDLKPIFVHARRARQDLLHIQHPAYKERTSIPTEELERGNMSLKLSDVRPSDQGRYECFIPNLNVNSFVELVVASVAVSPPIIDLAGIDRNRGGVILKCEAKGWYPEPELFWLDGEGNLLSAGPTETVRGPDDLYTVSRRLTVRKSDSFTCRVQQKNIKQTRETHFYVPDDFFELQSSSSAVTAGLAVSLAVCIMLNFSVIFLLWKWRRNIIKIKRRHRNETDQGRKKKSSETDGDEEEAQPLNTCENVPLKVSWNPYTWFEDEQKEVKKLTENIKRLKTEEEKKVEMLTKERKTNEDEQLQLKNELKTLKEEVEEKNKQVKKLTEEKKTNEDKQQQLQNELKEEVEKKKEFETKLTEVQQELLGEKNRRTEAEKENKALEAKLQDEQTKRGNAEEEVKKLRVELETKNMEIQNRHNNLSTSEASGEAQDD